MEWHRWNKLTAHNPTVSYIKVWFCRSSQQTHTEWLHGGISTQTVTTFRHSLAFHLWYSSLPPMGTVPPLAVLEPVVQEQGCMPQTVGGGCRARPPDQICTCSTCTKSVRIQCTYWYSYKVIYLYIRCRHRHKNGLIWFNWLFGEL